MRHSIEIERSESSEALVYRRVINTYTKGPLFCVLFVNSAGERVVHKFPLTSIFRIIQAYPKGKR